MGGVGRGGGAFGRSLLVLKSSLHGQVLVRFRGGGGGKECTRRNVAG